MIEYELDIYQALHVLLSGGSVRGQQFQKGLYMKLNKYGQLVLVDAKDYYKENEKIFFRSLASQNFREVSVFTIKELSK